MTPDEIQRAKEAAEMIVESTHDDDPYRAECDDGAINVARALLALLAEREDDDDPVTAEALHRYHFHEMGGPLVSTRSIFHVAPNLSLRGSNSGGWHLCANGACVEVCLVETVGQLRKLCAALGRPLEERTAPSEQE